MAGQVGAGRGEHQPDAAPPAPRRSAFQITACSLSWQGYQAGMEQCLGGVELAQPPPVGRGHHAYMWSCWSQGLPSDQLRSATPAISSTTCNSSPLPNIMFNVAVWGVRIALFESVANGRVLLHSLVWWADQFNGWVVG